MRIGILTLHKAYNYGAFMQAYSLQTGLMKKFPQDTIEIIDFVPFHEVYRYWIKVPAWILLHQGWKAFIKQYTKYRFFAKSRNDLTLSKNAGNTVKSLKKRAEEYDYIIVGSDAVFNDTDLTGITGISPFFLENVNTRKSSYAASAHGLDYLKYDENKKKRLRNALNCFELLGVRDFHTEAFVLSMLGKQDDERLMHSCDPTVFLGEFDECAHIKDLVLGFKQKGKTVIALMLKTERCGDIIKEVENERDCVFIALANSNRNADVQLIDISPFEWATCLKYVDYTVTDYFHGTLVSLRMGKPVISIDISKRKNENKTKIEDLLVDRLKLSEFYFSYASIMDQSKRLVLQNQCKRNVEECYQSKIFERLNEESRSFDQFCSLLNRRIHS